MNQKLLYDFCHPPFTASSVDSLTKDDLWTMAVSSSKHDDCSHHASRLFKRFTPWREVETTDVLFTTSVLLELSMKTLLCHHAPLFSRAVYCSVSLVVRGLHLRQTRLSEAVR